MWDFYLTGAGYGPLLWSTVSRSDSAEGWPLPDKDPPAPPVTGTTQSYYWQLLSGGCLGVGV